MFVIRERIYAHPVFKEGDIGDIHVYMLLGQKLKQKLKSSCEIT